VIGASPVLCELVQARRSEYVRLRGRLEPDLFGFTLGTLSLTAGSRGYAVSTVRFELEQVRTYIREQDAADEQAEF